MDNHGSGPQFCWLFSANSLRQVLSAPCSLSDGMKLLCLKGRVSGSGAEPLKNASRCRFKLLLGVCIIIELK